MHKNLLRTLWSLSAALLVGLTGTAGLAQTVPNSSAAQSAAIEVQFLEGLRLVESGNARQAIPIFQSILATDPGLVRVRLELARAYFLAESWSLAREEFFLVLSGDIPDGVRRTVLRFIREIDARRGFEWDLSLGITNAGSQRNYDTDQIDLDLGFGSLPFTLNRQDDSSLGLSFDAVARVRQQVDLSFGGRVATTGFAEVFGFGTKAEDERFDDYFAGLRAGLRFTAPRTTYSISPVFRSRFVAGNHAEDEGGLEGAFERRTSNGFSVFAAGSTLRVHDRIGLRSDADRLRFRVGVSRSVFGTASIGVEAFAEKSDFENDFDDFDDLRLTLFGTIEAPLGLRVQPTLFVGSRNFPSPSPLFTGNPDEHSYGGSLRLEKTDWFVVGGAFPFVEVAARRVNSGIPAFSYDEVTYNVGFRRRF